MDTRPLESIYTGPLDLLEKARRDRVGLRLAAERHDWSAARDKLFDFSVTAYHIVDWVKSFRKRLANTCLKAAPRHRSLVST